ncbi:MAG TPA: hypothetical protein VMW22_05040 [Candidatus Desulfaltia sp.]|nr:hypothetical protein [Candidatus Desulfaltia sp.]
MRTLLVVSRAHAETAFRLAEEMHMDGSGITILFTGRGTHHTSDLELIKRLSYADLITLETEFDSPLDEVRAVGYGELVKILEKCERTFSWI